MALFRDSKNIPIQDWRFPAAMREYLSDEGYQVNIVGNASVDNTGWMNTLSNHQLRYTPSLTPTIARLASTDDEDTSTGTGVRSIMLVGIDANGNEISEVLATAGTGVGVDSANQYVHINRAFALSVGSNGGAVSNININAPGQSHDFGRIEEGDTESGHGSYMVPNGFELYIIGGHMSGSMPAVGATATVGIAVGHRDNGMPMRGVAELTLSRYETTQDMSFGIYHKAVAGDLVRLIAHVTNNDTILTGNAYGILVPESNHGGIV